MTELEYLTRIANSLAAEQQSDNIKTIEAAASNAEAVTPSNQSTIEITA